MIGLILVGKAFATTPRWQVVEMMFIRIFQSELHWTDSLHFFWPFWLNNTHLCAVWKISYLYNLRVRFVAKIQIRIFNPKTDYWYKWSTTEVDSLDHTQNRILWIHDPRRFFTTDPKTVNTACGSTKQFWYIHQLFDYTLHIYGHFWIQEVGEIDDRFYLFH